MNLFTLFSKLIKEHRFMAFFVVFISTLVILCSVGLFTVSAYIIAFSALTPAIEKIMVPVVGVRFFGLSRGILRYVERLISHDTTFRLLSGLRNWLYGEISGAPMDEILHLDKEDAFTRLVDDIERLQEFYLRTFNPYVTAVLTGVFGTILLAIILLPTAAIFAVFYGLAIIVLPLIVYNFTKGLYKTHIAEAGKLKRLQLELISGLADLLASSATRTWKNRLNEQWVSMYDVERKLAVWKSLSTALITLLTHYALLIAIAIAGVFLYAGNFKAVFVPVIAYAILALFEGAQPIAIVLQKIEESKASAARVYELSNRCEPKESVTYETSPFDEIRMEQVSFRYKHGTKPLLNEIDLTLKKGQRLALIGSSGGGKSTLSYLLLGWLQPESGRITSKDNLEDQFSVVNQQVYFFNTTIRNNLKIADANATEEALTEVLEKVGLTDMISELPKGLDTELGEGDTKISGGQRQRLAIARALLRKTPYMIFDEMTAGLDVTTEKKLIETLLKATQDRGILVLTHRLVAMEAYDEILVLEEGRIIERGTHSKLLMQKGAYAKTYKIQQQYMDF